MDKKTTILAVASIAVLTASSAALYVINERAIAKLRRDVDNLLQATDSLLKSNDILIKRTARKEK